MKVKLLRDARIKHQAGEVVEITSQPELDFLLSTGSAQILRAAVAENPEECTNEVRETRTATRKAARKK